MLVIKVLIVLASVPLILVNLIPGLAKNDRPRLRKAGLILVSAFVVLVLISVAEFWYYGK